MIHTVRGTIEREQLGFCHSHEHLFLAPGRPSQINPVLCIDDYALTVSELKGFQELGGQSIVDAQPLGCGRMERELVKASSETGIHIIASTGFHKMDFYEPNHWVKQFDAEMLFDVFVHELRNGMYTGSDRNLPAEHIKAKAGVIKTAVDDSRMKDSDKKWFEAAAAAASLTGAPILCHIESANQAVWVAEFYLARGILPSSIIICHLDRTLEHSSIHKHLAGLGIFLEYDTIGRFKYHSDEQEAEWIVSMLESGLEDQLLLGLDTTRARLRSYGGEIGLNHIIEVFIPLLKRYGVTDDLIRKMMVGNPAKAFEFN